MSISGFSKNSHTVTGSQSDSGVTRMSSTPSTSSTSSSSNTSGVSEVDGRDNSPAVQRQDKKDAGRSNDLEQWSADARSLNKKFDELIDKLDALLLLLDSSLGDVSVDSAMSNLRLSTSDFRIGAQNLHKKLQKFDVAIQSAFIVASKMSDGEPKVRLLSAAKEAENSLKSFLLPSRAPSLHSRTCEQHRSANTPNIERSKYTRISGGDQPSDSDRSAEKFDHKTDQFKSSNRTEPVDDDGSRVQNDSGEGTEESDHFISSATESNDAISPKNL